MQVKKLIKISGLLFKKISGTIISEEISELSEWIKIHNNENFIKEITSESRLKNNMNNHSQFNSGIAFNLFLKKTSRAKRIYLISSIMKYAAIFILLAITSVFILKHIPKSSNKQFAEDIVPGGQKAVLILGNNNKIDLTQQSNTTIETEDGIIDIKSGKLLYNSKNESLKTNPSKYNTLIIPKGGEYHLILSDGTQIYINSDSKIRYPERFIVKTRKVYLEGEAYFKVAHDASKPFIVETKNYSVNVLGTSFNISHYENDQTVHTTLVEGEVKISSIKGVPDKTYLLKPNEQFTLDKYNLETNVHKVDPDLYIAWTNGYFLFEDESLENIFKKLERWYGLKVFFKNDEIKNILYSGKLPRFENFSVILEMLETIDNVKFNVSEKTVIIDKS